MFSRVGSWPQTLCTYVGLLTTYAILLQEKEHMEREKKCKAQCWSFCIWFAHLNQDDAEEPTQTMP